MNRIRNERHVTLFTVPDGGSITINGKSCRVEFLDETHFNLVSPDGWKECYHIDQFGDKVVGNGNTVDYSPEEGVQEEIFQYFIQDNFGFVVVPKALLREIHLFSDLSWRSHQKDGMAYLEDRRDTSLFRSTMEHRGKRVKFVMVREGVPPIKTYDCFDRNEAKQK